jgi:hypothetical protein
VNIGLQKTDLRSFYMKNLIKRFGIIAFVAVIVFLIAGCMLWEQPEEEESGETSDSAFSLPKDDYINGAITSAVKEQWFKFTATASTHYIHVVHDMLSDFSVQLYDNNKSAVGSKHNYHQSQLNYGYIGWYSEIAVTRGKKYYLKVTPYSGSETGAYRIGCNTMELSPGSLPKAKILAADTWVDGLITLDRSGDDSLYKFTATTAATHYLHIKLGTLTPPVYVRFFNSSGDIVVERTSLTGNGYIYYSSLTNGSVYYASVWSASSNTGTYQIAFNTSTTAPW